MAVFPKNAGVLDAAALRRAAVDPELMLEHLTTAVLLWDSHLEVVYVNGAAETLLAVSANQVAGAHLLQLFPGAEPLALKVGEALRDGSPFAEREMPLTLPAGTQTVADCVITPLGPAGATGRGALMELLPLERHLQISREEQIVAQGETVRHLVRSLAHEIKNPLGGLRGAAQLLERELEDEALKEYTRVIVHEADRLQGLVDRMLAPKTVPQKRWINVHEVSERVYTLMRAENPASVLIERDYDPSIPEIHGDPELLIQAMLNVGQNAAEAVGGEGTVTLRTRVQRQIGIGHRHHRMAARIDVVDDGAGIEPEIRDRIFYPLVTGRAEGHGLGLTIAQAVLNQHGGLVECDSRPGRTVFTLLLPIPEPDEMEGGR